MLTPLSLVVGTAALAGLGVAVLLGRRAAKAWFAYRGLRIVVCPESQETTAVVIDAGRAALAAASGRLQLRLESCTRWPQRADCGQECLGQIESAPEACRLRSILDRWYGGKACAFCGRVFGVVRWHDHRPALISAEGALADWSGFRPEQVVDVLTTHRPICWDCRTTEGFRREHPERVTDRG